MEIFSASLARCAGNSPVPVNSPHKGQWRGALMFYLISAWISSWVNNREAGDLRRNRVHYDANVMFTKSIHKKNSTYRQSTRVNSIFISCYWRFANQSDKERRSSVAPFTCLKCNINNMKLYGFECMTVKIHYKLINFVYKWLHMITPHCLILCNYLVMP